jgi:hypothetical protein
MTSSPNKLGRRWSLSSLALMGGSFSYAGSLCQNAQFDISLGRVGYKNAESGVALSGRQFCSKSGFGTGGGYYGSVGPPPFHVAVNTDRFNRLRIAYPSTRLLRQPCCQNLVGNIDRLVVPV